MSRRAPVAAGIAALLAGCAAAVWFVTAAARHGGNLTVAAGAGFATGAIAGALGTLFVWAARAARGPEPKRLALGAGELVVLERAANHLHGLGGGHGVLMLSTRRLLFHARKMSFDREPRALDLESIRDVHLDRFGQLVVSQATGDQVFVVQDSGDVALLIRRLAAAPEAERAAVAAAWRDQEPV
jgi:hypothetical protein